MVRLSSLPLTVIRCVVIVMVEVVRMVLRRLVPTVMDVVLRYNYVK